MGPCFSLLLAAVSWEQVSNCSGIIMEEIRDFLEGRELQGAVGGQVRYWNTRRRNAMQHCALRRVLDLNSSKPLVLAR